MAARMLSISLIGELVGEAVGGEQIEVAGLRVVALDLGLDAWPASRWRG